MLEVCGEVTVVVVVVLLCCWSLTGMLPISEGTDVDAGTPFEVVTFEFDLVVVVVLAL